MILLPELSLYIHIPWCTKKCPYCDFHSFVSKKKIPENAYVKKLIQDFKNDKKFIQDRKVKSIFIGGGTPNLLNISLIQYLIENIKNEIKIDEKLEITIEINPELINIEKILQYIELGINRISIGIQSFKNESLQLLGRNNTAEISINLLNEIKKQKININIDLIYGIPKQTLEDCLYDLKQAIIIKPNHISWYQLSIEKNTIFYSQNLDLPDDDVIWNMYNMGDNLLNQFQYKKYEISAYSKDNYQCLHNLNYWTFGDYLGIGCGAHSKITKKTGEIIRIIKKRNLFNYLNDKKCIEKKYKVKKKDIAFEYFMNLFRLFKPIEKKKFHLYTGLKYDIIKKPIQKAIQKKYILENKKYWIVLPDGKNFLNNLLELFLSL